MNRNCRIRGLIRSEELVLNNISVPCRGKLLNRSSTSMLLRTVSSTLLNTTTLKSVNGLFPSVSAHCGKTSDLMLLHRIKAHLTATKCEVIGVSSALVIRTPGLTPRVRRVHTGVTHTLNVSLSSMDMGTAARRRLNFANRKLNVTTRTIYLVRDSS